MHRLRTTVVSVAALAASLIPAGVVGATESSVTPASDEIGRQVLDLLCELKDGTAVATPFAVARCQEARSRWGFEVERLVCEGLLEGHFASAPSFGRPQRTTWSCFDPTPAG